ncbi:MAG: AAA family ATPase [Pirellulales bacterium]|nr:AAA family ATPase [Pirellulales bacterium]
MNHSVLSPTRPFSQRICVGHAFLDSDLEQVLENTARAVARQEGVSLVTGAIGTGKSLLSQLLVAGLRKSVRRVVLANGGLTTRKALLKTLLHQLGGNISRSGEAELKIAVAGIISQNGPVCVIIDDAHKLTTDQLEELQSLSNLTTNNSGVVSLVLVGQTRLEEALTHPSLQSLNQQISQRAFIKAFNFNQMRDYLSHHVQLVGLQLEDHFDDSAIRCIYDLSDGVPRVVNQIADRSILLACRNGIELLGEYEIQCGWADIQQMPVPKPAPALTEDQFEDSPNPQTTSSIEFGSLSESVEFGALESEFQSDIQQNEFQNKTSESQLASVSETLEPSECEVTSPIAPLQDSVSITGDSTSSGADWENDAIVARLLTPPEAPAVSSNVVKVQLDCDRDILIEEDAFEVESELIEIEEHLNQHYGRLFDRLRRA